MQNENEKDKPAQPATKAAVDGRKETNRDIWDMDGIKNAFLVAMAHKAKGDWGKILGYLQHKVPFSDQEIEKAFARCNAKGLCPVVYGNAYYPKELESIPKPPFVLFAAGNLALIKNDGRERFGIIVFNEMEKEQEDEARRAMAEKKPLIAYFTTDTASTAFEKELKIYCEYENGLLITENLGAQKSRKFAVQRAARLLMNLGIPSLHSLYSKQAHEKTSEEPEQEA